MYVVAVWPRADGRFATPTISGLVAAVLLGASPSTWRHEPSGCYFECRPHNLTGSGIQLMSTLDDLCGVQGRLLTYLDT